MLGHEVKCLTCITMQIMYFTEQKIVNKKLFMLFTYNYLKLGYPYLGYYQGRKVFTHKNASN